jgi:predicted MFS family arabinose efflux permease
MQVETLSRDRSPSSKTVGWAEFRVAFPALVAAFIGNALNGGSLCFYSLGVLAPTLHSVYGWSVGGIAGSLLAITGTTLLVSPIIGAIIDRFGVKRVAALSAALMSFTLALFALLPLTLPLYLALWSLVALLGAGCFPVTWSRLINQHFRLKRGLALGISFVGTGLTGFFLKPALFTTIEHHGLNAGFWLLAALPLVTLATTLLFIRSPKTQSASLQAALPGELSGYTLRTALSDGRFWLLAVVVLAAALGVGGPLPNTESVLRSLGHSNGDAVSIARSIGLAIIAGRIFGGALLDRLWAPAVGAVGLFLGGIGCLAIWSSSGPSSAAGFEVFLIGLASGLETDLVAYLVVKYFGLRSYASIYGALYGLFSLGTGLGAIAFGTAFDVLRSYTAVLAIFGIVLIVSAGLILFLGPYRYQEQTR